MILQEILSSSLGKDLESDFEMVPQAMRDVAYYDPTCAVGCLDEPSRLL
jgi:hypothetical protein